MLFFPEPQKFGIQCRSMIMRNWEIYSCFVFNRGENDWQTDWKSTLSNAHTTDDGKVGVLERGTNDNKSIDVVRHLCKLTAVRSICGASGAHNPRRYCNVGREFFIQPSPNRNVSKRKRWETTTMMTFNTIQNSYQTISDIHRRWNFFVFLIPPNCWHLLLMLRWHAIIGLMKIQ
jgi:hypothetical protein